MTNQGAQFENNGVSNRVIDVITGTASMDQPGVGKCLKMFRDIGLVAVEQRGDFIDAFSAGFEALQQTQARGVPEHAKAMSHQVQHFIAER